MCQYTGRCSDERRLPEEHTDLRGGLDGLLALATVLPDVQAHHEPAGRRAEGLVEPADLGDDVRDADAVAVEVADQLEDVRLGLPLVELVLVAGERNLAEEEHLVLLVGRELLGGRRRAAHHQVRPGELVTELLLLAVLERAVRNHVVLVQRNSPWGTPDIPGSATLCRPI